MIEKNQFDGFKVIKKEESQELGGILWEFRHISTDAHILWMENQEENKLFSITFKTLPWDDSGVFHILEHTVLNGSEKFRVKEPFVDLLKGSLKTYLNAMTTDDKTIFPVSSKNEKDFLNLAEVYLDAVFAPAIYDNSYSFLQEGWHYEPGEDGIPTVNGVVLNEMRGAFSSPDTQAANGLRKLLYPDTIYQYVPGGDPDYIPNLTRNDFLKAHGEFYHPSNSYTYLDGNLPIGKILTMLDSYFNRFSKMETLPSIPLQPLRDFSRSQGLYQAEEEEGALISLGRIIGDNKDKKRLIAFQVLCDYLAGSNESPLKKAILEEGLAQEVYLYLVDDIAIPYLTLQLLQGDYDRKEEIYELIDQVIENEISKGLDKEKITAILDQMELLSKDIEEPAGLNRNFMALTSWIYDMDPLNGMLLDPILKELRRDLDGNLFPELMTEISFRGKGCAEYSLLPSPNYSQEKWQEERKQLAQISKDWNQKKEEEIRLEFENLLMWQQTPDSEEDKQTLPELKVEDLGQEPALVETDKIEIQGCPVLIHHDHQKGLTFYTLYFSMAGLTTEEMQALSLFTNLAGEISTKNYSFDELDKEKRKLFGYLDYNIEAFGNTDNPKETKPYFSVSFSCLESKSQQAMELAREIIKNTIIDSNEFVAMTEIILYQCRESLYQGFIEEGSRFASLRADARFYGAAVILDETTGLEFYNYICNFLDHMEERMAAYQEQMKNLIEKIFVKERMTVSVIGDTRKEWMEQLITDFKGNMSQPIQESMKVGLYNLKNEWIVIPSQVAFVAHSAYLGKEARHGAMDVLANIISYDHLWNEIRVKGNAYDCSMRTGFGGYAGFTTYRDSDPAGSLQAFYHTADFLKNYLANKINIQPYIIGAAGEYDPLLHRRNKAMQADRYYFQRNTAESIKKRYEELLKTDTESLCANIKWFENNESDFATCIFGPADYLEPKELGKMNIIEL